MSFECEVCGAFLDGDYPCSRCGYDPMEPDRDDGPLAFDGGREEPGIEGHLEDALNVTESPEVRYHIRSALQLTALVRGDVGWRGTYGPENGGVVD